MNHTVIMAGGSGTRFWPESRQATPKQLLRLAGDRTMIQMTSDRVRAISPAEQQWIVTNALQAGRVAEQLADVPSEQILIEPAARNTAPCVGLAAIHLLAKDPTATMLVLPADQVIQTNAQFCQAASGAIAAVEDAPDSIVLFGVKPTFPSVGYGYIERGDAVGESLYRVESFREKPNEATAQQYLDDGRFYWNCGVFVWKAATILDRLQEYEPEIFAGLDTIAKTIGTNRYESTVAEVFPTLPSISIDYAVLERAASICVMEAPFEWDDIGAWQALPRLLGTDENGNTIDGPHVGRRTTNTIVRSPQGHTVATFGVDSLIIVHTPDATLVADRNDETGVKQLVEAIRSQGLEELL